MARAVTLHFEVLHGVSFVPVRPLHIRKGQIFRVRTASGSPHFAVGNALKDFEGADDGVYIACEDGDEHGVAINVYPDVMRFTVTSGPPG